MTDVASYDENLGQQVPGTNMIWETYKENETQTTNNWKDSSGRENN